MGSRCPPAPGSAVYGSRQRLPADQADQAGQHVVADVPRVEQTAEQEHERQQQQRRAGSARPRPDGGCDATQCRGAASPTTTSGWLIVAVHAGSDRGSRHCDANAPWTSEPWWPRNQKTCHGWKIVLDEAATALRARREASPEASSSGARTTARDRAGAGQAAPSRPRPRTAGPAAPVRSRAAPTPCSRLPARSTAAQQHRRPLTGAASSTARYAQAAPSSSSGWPEFEGVEGQRVDHAHPSTSTCQSAGRPASRIRAHNHTPNAATASRQGSATIL